MSAVAKIVPITLQSPSKLGEGDHLALLSAGAYGFVMASSYNSRSLAAEVIVKGKNAFASRERQPVEEIWAGEKIAPGKSKLLGEFLQFDPAQSQTGTRRFFIAKH